MTNEIQHSDVTEHKPIPFGVRLKNAREAKGLERKDAAAQLRLNEKIIIMLEKDRYPADLPVTFIRGYMRSYGKFLEIPDYEIKKAVEPIKPKVTTNQTSVLSATQQPVTSGNYFMQFFTYVILLTMLGLVATWWYSHSNLPAPQAGENGMTAAPSDTATPAASAIPNPPDVIAIAPPTQPANPPTPTTTAEPAQAAPTPTEPPIAPQQNTEDNHASANSPTHHHAKAAAPVDSSSQADDDANDSSDGNSDNTDNTETISDNAD